MSSFELLINEHEMLMRAAGDVDRALLKGAGQNAGAMAALERLSVLLDDHLAREDEELYPQLMLCGDTKTAQMAEDFAAEFSELRLDWRRYLERWRPGADAGNWAAFCRATRAILARLAERIRQENDLLYPAALEASIITLRARAA